MANILVIDDENNIRLMVRLTLQHSGHIVQTAADGAEGLEKFANGLDWDLVLLDQRMPGMDGLSVLREIHKRDVQARVIMATAFGTIDLAVEAMKLGATDFLRKPFTAETLRGAVEAALAPAPPPAPPNGGMTFSMTTINGFRLESLPTAVKREDGALRFDYMVASPTGERRSCAVVLKPLLLELVKAHADRDTLPGGDRFWHALGEESLANYVWQNADFPLGDRLDVEELTGGLRRWIDAVLAIPASV
ncbi:MAG: Response regulator containing CheY-like receiver,AAA-type ATPase, and DNA-binding domain [Chthonomonadaceae bacterium]|nr:Response regulator containing CheY-like receiver,AAA-type ATPase, and DNA-binding domain [Chthonomonadaceae bacterium]